MEKKYILIEVTKDWHPYFCGLCYPHECNGNRGCPLPNAKEAVKLPGNGVRMDMFAVAEDAENTNYLLADCLSCKEYNKRCGSCLRYNK